MTVNWEQFQENKSYIQERVSEQYPGVTIAWEDDTENELSTPSIRLPENFTGETDGIIAAAKEAILECGSEAIFHPEKAYDTKTGDPAPL